MTTTPNPEQLNVVTQNARRDRADGYERGYLTPYPKDKEEVILVNIGKVSPDFVKGYKEGKLDREFEDRRGDIDTEEEREWWDEQYKKLYR